MRLAFVGQQEYFGCHYESDLDDIYSVKRIQLRYDTSQEYYAELLDFNPDVTFVFRGELLPPTVVENLSGVRIAYSTEPMPKVVDDCLQFTSDSLGRFRHFLTVFERDYDLVFHYDEVSMSFLENQGIHLSGFSPLPIATNIYRRLAADQTRDIVFFGRSTAHREKILGPLKRDFDVLHLAHGWPGARRHLISEFLSCINSFQICLNIHAEDEVSWEPRIQQALSCGCLVVSERISPNDYLVPGEHYLEAATPEGFYETCRKVLAEPKLGDKVRASGYRVVRDRLCARTWFPELLRAVQAGRFKKATFERRCFNVEPLEAMLQYSGFAHVERFMRLRRA